MDHRHGNVSGVPPNQHHHHHHHFHYQSGAPSGGGGGGVARPGAAAASAGLANEYFEHFIAASSLKHILGYYRSICDVVGLRPAPFAAFYPKVRGGVTSWRAKELWKKFDARATQKCYAKGTKGGATNAPAAPPPPKC